MITFLRLQPSTQTAQKTSFFVVVVFDGVLSSIKRYILASIAVVA
jgi:hypothetical protein